MLVGRNDGGGDWEFWDGFFFGSLYSLFHGFSDQQAQWPLLGRS
jgi:hypothetical protein